MTQLRSLLERIEAGSGPSLGFGSTQSGRLPGMALIARCSGDVEAALAASAEVADAVVIFAPGVTPDALPETGDRIWGAGGAPLEPEGIARWRDAGADFTVSPFATALVDGIDIASPGMTHGARIPDDVDGHTWRILAGTPLDFLVLDKSAMTGPWMLADLGQAADAARRTDKYLIVRVGPRPSANELLALRQAGAVAIVAEANDHGAEGLAAIKTDLMAMPRAQPPSRRGGRTGLESAAT
ncbi:MAG: hypothetical protein OXL37_08345 [Chloroflexota bacterium]|nr:hypothetical protein [Chloroflexota bacterium]MDE2959638.1 hypothetical protein [Chloroflexota bacterium]